MAGRFTRSLALVKASWSVLKSDKELMLFPVFSLIATVLVVVSFLVPAVAAGWVGEQSHAAEPDAAVYVWTLVFYIVAYFVTIFFNTALVGAAMMRLDGQDPTVRDGLSIAWARVGRIFGYACIAATVGLLLRAIEERIGWLGRIVVALIGVAWTLATFLVVPLLVARDIGPVDAVKESAQLLRRTWGENLIGNAGMSLAFIVAYVLLLIGCGAILGAGMSFNLPVVAGLAVVLGIGGFIVLTTLQATLQGIYSAALYRFASDGDAGVAGFEPDLLQQAFRHRK
jgi:hypothetical protein